MMKLRSIARTTSLLLVSAAAVSGVAGAHRAKAPRAKNAASRAAGYGRLPLSFELNRGQADPKIRYVARGQGFTLGLASNQAFLNMARAHRGSKPGAPARTETSLVRMKLLGARSTAPVVGATRLPGTVNYFIGADPREWRTGIPTYAQVKCQGVYPGVDLVYYGSTGSGREPGGELEYDFVVAPGADTGQIRLSFSPDETGAPAPVRITAEGDLVVEGKLGELRHRRPVVYQEEAGRRCRIAAGYRVAPSGEIGFSVGEYDRSRPLVIDPTFAYSSYLGGSGDDYGYGIAIDPAGEAVVAGTTASTNFPLAAAGQATPGGGTDAFVTKLNAAGNAAIYSTYLGGSADESSSFSRMGVAVDSSGAAYVVGFTNSKANPNDPNAQAFPTTAGAFQSAAPGFGETFVSKLSPNGSSLVYSTLLGGGGWDYGNSIAVDSSGNACICGATGSSDFPVTASAYDKTFGGALTDVFVTKLNATGSGLLYSTYIGGSGNDDGNAIVLDASGNIYITGGTNSVDDPNTAGVNEGFPTTSGVYQTAAPGGYDAFICKVNPNLSGAASLVFSSRFGGSSNENINHDGGIALDADGNIYITGTTNSTDLPVLNAIQPAMKGTWDAYVAKFNPTCSTLLWSTHLGAALGTEGNSIAVDGSGNVYVSGQAIGDNLPLVSPLQTFSGGGADAYLAQFSSTGSLLFSTYLGGTGDENTSFRGFGAVRVDGSGGVYLTGATHSGDMAVQGAVQGATGGGWDAYVVKLNFGSPPARPTNLQATAVSNSQINLSWTDNSSGETGFEIQRQTGAAGFVTVTTTAANVTSYQDKGLAGSTTYTYRVRTVQSGNTSLFSDTASATTQADPAGDPTNLTATPLSATSVKLNWQDHSSNETSFRVERKTGAGSFAEIGSVGSNVTTYTDQSAASATTYVYRVRAQGPGGYSGYTNEASATTPASVPAAPSNLVATAVSTTQINLNWSDNSNNEQAFELERKTGDGAFALVAALGIGATAYSDTGLTPATTYFYRVRATNSGGDSAYSNTASATTQAGAIQPPAAPSNLTASAISAGRVDLTWTDNSNNETQFKIERKAGSGAFAQIASVNANVGTYSDLTVSPNTVYTYQVRASNTGGDSDYSNTASASTPADSIVAPSNLAATVVSATRIDLSWKDNSANETGFQVERQTSGAVSFDFLGTVAVNTTSYTDQGLQPDTSYVYRLKAVNANTSSAYSATASAHTLPTVPSPPGALTATAVSSTEIDLTWNDNSSNETEFDIERRTQNTAYVPAGTVAAGVTAFQDSGLNPATTYTYRVRAKNAAGFSDYSSESSATTLPNPPGGPTNLQATLLPQAFVSLSWTDNDAGITGFKLERRTAAGVYTQVGTTPSGTFAFTDGPLAAGTTYYYRVRATNAGGNSGYSNEASVTTNPEVPAAPSGLSGTAASGTEIDLSWTDNSVNESGFYIERRTGAGAYSQVGAVDAGVVSYADHGVTAGNTYTYRVRAYNVSGTSGYSNEAPVTIAAPPPAPANLTATVTTESAVALAWTRNGNPSTFLVERKSGAGNYAQIASIAAATTTYSDTGLSANTAYTYRVRAHNSAGDSTPSNEATVLTPRGTMTVTPTKINFGTLRAGTTKSATVTIRNTNKKETLRITVGALSAPWRVDGGTGTRILGPKGLLTLHVSYAPTAAGANTGTLAITSSDSSHSSVSVSLTGKAR